MGQSYDICFLSILYPQGIPEYDALTYKHRAQNITAIQNSLLEGIAAANSGENPWIINTLLVPLYKKGYTAPTVKERPLADRQGINHGYLNLPGLHSMSLFWGARKHIRKWSLNNRNERPKVLIAYSLTSYTLKAMNYAKALNPSIRTVIIVPDLPQYTYGETSNPLAKIINALGKHKVIFDIHKYSSQVDGWFCFSEHMQEKIPCCKKYMVLEGIASDTFAVIDAKRMRDEDIVEIVYAGGCNKKYGLPLLIDAFQSIEDKKMRLIICGKGDYQTHIEERAREDSRIIYLGEIPRKELLELQKGADLLVNPRVNCGIFTKYSFPSKNMESLSSGTPFLGYKLEGIPDEYDQYINYFSEPTADSLAEAILAICNHYDSAKANALLAQRYVLETKDKYSWGKKIIAFFDDL